MIRTAFFVLLFAVIAGVGFAATPPALVRTEGNSNQLMQSQRSDCSREVLSELPRMPWWGRR